MNDPKPLNTRGIHEQEPHSLDGATFNPIDRTLDPTPKAAVTNTQITLDYRVHREIFRAIAFEDEAALRSTWVQYGDIGIRGEDVFAFCVQLRRYELIPVLLDLGAKPDKLRSSYLAPLLTRKVSEFKRLVEVGAPVNDESGRSEALHRAVLHAATHLDLYSLSWFSERRADPYDFSFIEFLLKHGARMDPAMSEVQRTSIHPDVRSLNWCDAHISKLLSLFEQYGAELRTDVFPHCSVESVGPAYTLEQAILSGDVSKVIDLLSVDPHILSLVKNPLTKGCQSNSLRMVRYLLDNNCDVNEDFGRPLLFAVSESETSGLFTPLSLGLVLRLLLERGADPAMRGAEAFINACTIDPDSLAAVFFTTNSLPKSTAQLTAALQALIKKSYSFSDLKMGNPHIQEPIIKHLTMVKSLVERGADPYTAIPYRLEAPSLEPAHEEIGIDLTTPSSHYTEWAKFLRERLKEQPTREESAIDKCYQSAEDFLSTFSSLIQLGNEALAQLGSISHQSSRYCYLMAQALEPSSPCWINSLITDKQRQIPESMICPSLLKNDTRYKMLSDVAAIAVVLHRPLMVRRKFLDLAKATFSDKVKLKDSQQSNETVVEWLPITKRLVSHFADMVLFPELLRQLSPEKVPFMTSSVLERVRQDLGFMAAEALFDGRSLREIRDFTKRWHALAKRHPIPISLRSEWPSILQQPIALPNGHVLQDLTSCQRIREVGGTMHNCLEDGIHASECFLGLSRIFAIFKDDVPIVAMTLEKRDEGWELTENEGPDYTQPEEGPDAPLTLFKQMLRANQIHFNPVGKCSIPRVHEYDNLTSDGFMSKYSNYLDNNRTELAVEQNHSFLSALQSPGINAAAFYQRWVTLDVKGGANTAPLLRDECVEKCIHSIREMAMATSLFLEYSQRLYESYPRYSEKTPGRVP